MAADADDTETMWDSSVLNSIGMLYFFNAMLQPHVRCYLVQRRQSWTTRACQPLAKFGPSSPAGRSRAAHSNALLSANQRRRRRSSPAFVWARENITPKEQASKDHSCGKQYSAVVKMNFLQFDIWREFGLQWHRITPGQRLCHATIAQGVGHPIRKQALSQGDKDFGIFDE
eukprot:4976249-Amphidinium_carterae.1